MRLLRISAGNEMHAEEAIDHLRRFIPKTQRFKKTELSNILPRRLLPPDCSIEVHTAVHETLRRHLSCTCTCGKGNSGGEHMAKLLRCLPPEHVDVNEHPDSICSYHRLLLILGHFAADGRISTFQLEGSCDVSGFKIWALSRSNIRIWKLKSV